MTKNFPEDVLKKGCHTTVTVLCLEKDLKVKAMLDTGCSPNNYMREEYFEQHEAYLTQYIIKESPERVDLATNDSAQYITRHVQLSMRHVDSRGRMRLMTLKFGILKGLRFDMVIGLYAISFHFMEVIQDLLTLQLEAIESKNPELALLYGQPQQSFLTMMSSPGTDDSRSSTPASVEPEMFNHGRTVQFMLRYPYVYCQRQIDQQRAYEVDHPAEWHDFGDHGLLRSCDSISSVEETRPEQHLRWLREANSDPYAGVSIELDALDRDVLQPYVAQPASPRSQVQVPLQQPGVPVNNESMDPVQQVSPLSSPIQESASPDTPPKVSAQPFVRIGGDFRLPSNPTQSQNSTRSSLSNFLAMKLTNKFRTAYWPSVFTGKDKITACLAWGSPHIQDHRFRASVKNTLIPLDEHHVRMWLREIYPSQFSPAADLNADDNASLELEEIRSTFRALLSGNIKPIWFVPRVFNASVRESLGLVLRNQRDRFFLSYYQGIAIDYPQDEDTNRFVWRYVFTLIARHNQLLHSELWRADFHSQLCDAMPTLSEVNDVDREIVALLEGLPASMTPATSTFDTSDHPHTTHC